VSLHSSPAIQAKLDYSSCVPLQINQTKESNPQPKAKAKQESGIQTASMYEFGLNRIDLGSNQAMLVGELDAARRERGS
jgi:hypothetical protein